MWNAVSKKDLNEVQSLLDSRFNELEERANAAEERCVVLEKKVDQQEHIIQTLQKEFEISDNRFEDLSNNKVNENQDDTLNNAATSGLKRCIIYDAATFSSCLFRLIFAAFVCFYIYSVIINEPRHIWLWIAIAMMTLSLICEMRVEQFQGKIWRATYLLYLPVFILILFSASQVSSFGSGTFGSSINFKVGLGMLALGQGLHMFQLALRHEKQKMLTLSYLILVISSIIIATDWQADLTVYLYPFHALLFSWGLPLTQQVEFDNHNTSTIDAQEQDENSQYNSDVIQNTGTDDVENNTIVSDDKSNEGIHRNNHCFTANKTNIPFRASHRSTAQWKILNGFDAEKGNEELDYDTYSMMMLSRFWTTLSFRLCCKYKDTMVIITCPSISWTTGLFTFIIQVGLGMLIMVDQWNKPEFNTEWNIPGRVDLVVAIGQFLSVIAALMTQTDVLMPVQVLHRLWYKKGKDLEWNVLIGEENNASLSLWCFRILVPNILKMLQGILILIASFIIIIQSDDIVELLKDFTALFVISSLDNIIFMVADNEFLGKVLSEKVDEVKSTKLKKEQNTINVWLHIIFACMILGMLVGWIYVRIGQNSGKYMRQKYLECNINHPNKDLLSLEDGRCEREFNIKECGWDGGDCIEFNEKYPECNVTDPSLIGNWRCDDGPYNTEECGWDGGDCIEFNHNYPNCNVDDSSLIGNGRCDGGAYSSKECGWDGGDCTKFFKRYPDCFVGSAHWIHNGVCHGGDYNTKECGWDGGDCIEFNLNYPDCDVDWPFWIGDGLCNGGTYNTEECGWDGGDCIEFNQKYPDCHVDSPIWIGNGLCDGGAHNTEECGWDGGDCKKFNEKYPDCHVSAIWVIGDGFCNIGDYNTEECGRDEGDCITFNERYPDCIVDEPSRIGDGFCDIGAYNTEECGWDEGDCIIFNERYPDCNVTDPSFIGNERCDGGAYNTVECHWDGGDCVLFNAQYPNCNVENPWMIGDKLCNGGAYETEECDRDGGDCL